MSALVTMRAMALEAFGAYMRRLRDRSGLTQAGLVQELNGTVSLRTIGRWENGRHEPYISELAPVLARLRGSMMRAVLLVMSDSITVTEAERMAERADDDLTVDEIAFFASLSPERRKLFRQFIEAEEKRR